MTITEVRVTLRDDGKLKAFASITIENCFVVRDLKVIEGASSLFVAMPSRRRPDGSYRDIAHPINQETRTLVETAVLAEYEIARRGTGTSG
jgi:stage V sporulation protein G